MEQVPVENNQIQSQCILTQSAIGNSAAKKEISNFSYYISFITSWLHLANICNKTEEAF